MSEQFETSKQVFWLTKVNTIERDFPIPEQSRDYADHDLGYIADTQCLQPFPLLKHESNKRRRQMEEVTKEKLVQLVGPVPPLAGDQRFPAIGRTHLISTSRLCQVLTEIRGHGVTNWLKTTGGGPIPPTQTY